MSLGRRGPERTAADFTRLALLVSLLPPLAGVYLIVVLSRHHWPHALVLTWYALLGWGLFELAVRRGWRLGLFLAFAAFNLLFLTPEAFLRLGGFHYEAGIRFGESHPLRFVRLVEDEGLFWTLPKGSPGVNAHGFKTRPLPQPGEPDLPGRLRVVFLGDSLEYQGYPEIAETLLNRRPDGAERYEVYNLSVAGYSSFQGRRIAEKYGDTLAADVAVIAYGWNDHWLAWGAPDAERVVRRARSIAARAARAVYRSSRLVQALRYLIDRPSEAGDALRVPPDQFRANLVFLGELFRDRGAVPLLLTFPSAHPHLGVPSYLVERGYAKDPQSVLELHRTYSRIVREVAAEKGWPVLDLEAELGSLDEAELRRIFLDDGIHLTTGGLALVALRVASAIAEIERP